MLKYLSQYTCEYEDQLNVDLMNKTADDPLYVYVLDAWKSLEICPNIRISKWEYNTVESEIDINKHIYKRKKRQRKKEKVEYKYINDNRIGRLTIWVDISCLEADPKTKAVMLKEKTVKKNILIPLQDERGYFHINGKPYYLLYQLVEKSTYTTSQTVTFKSLMPISIKRNILDKEDTEGNLHRLPVYNVYLFRKEVPIMLLYAAMGLRTSLDELYVGDIIDFVSNVDDVEDLDDYIYFQISSKCYIRCDRKLFDKYPYVQSIVGGMLFITTNRFTVEQLYDVNVWYKKLGNNGKPEKGKEILQRVQRLLDETTKKVLKISDYHTADAYSLIRYAMMNFNELRIKDNMSLENKRLRCNEYIASLLTKELSHRLNRVISMGAKATIVNFMDMLKLPDDILLQKMHASGVLRFNECINDMTFFNKFKWTIKGPHSVGSKNSNNIGMQSRNIHPSYIGNIDLFTCGNSDRQQGPSKTSLTAGILRRNQLRNQFGDKLVARGNSQGIVIKVGSMG